MKNNLTTTIDTMPIEVKSLATMLPDKKQGEVQKILNGIFAGTDAWEAKVDAILINGIEDTVNIALAESERKLAKVKRLEAEKIFDAKRSEVKNLKIEFDTEDSLWLKAKQIAQIKLKAIEDKAEYKATFVKRYIHEQKELTTQIREAKVQKFSQELTREDFENMSDIAFDSFIAGVEANRNAKIIADAKADSDRAEKQKIDQAVLEAQRLENEMLKKQAEENNKVLKELQAKADADTLIAKGVKDKANAVAKSERDKTEALQRQINKVAKKAEAEKQLVIEKIDAEKKALAIEAKKALKAPDKVKLLALAMAISNIPLPVLNSLDANIVLENTKVLISKINTYITEHANNI